MDGLEKKVRERLVDIFTNMYKENPQLLNDFRKGCKENIEKFLELEMVQGKASVDDLSVEEYARKMNIYSYGIEGYIDINFIRRKHKIFFFLTPEDFHKDLIRVNLQCKEFNIVPDYDKLKPFADRLIFSEKLSKVVENLIKLVEAYKTERALSKDFIYAAIREEFLTPAAYKDFIEILYFGSNIIWEKESERLLLFMEKLKENLKEKLIEVGIKEIYKRTD